MESPNNFCRLCGSVLRGNHRRWLFSRSSSSSRPDLLVILSYVLDRELPQRGDGRGEFLCGKCAHTLARVYNFDTVIARIQALSIESLQRLLLEKDQLVRSLRHIYMRRFPDNEASVSYTGQEISASIADLPHVQYQRLLQDDMALSEYECWADAPDSSQPGTPCRNRQCRSCHGLRVDDNTYEWVCRTPRRLGSPVFPLCRDKSQSMPTVCCMSSQASLRSQSLGDVESCSMLSLDTLPELELAWEALKNLKDIRRKPLKVPSGSKIPVLVGNWQRATPRRERPLEKELFEDLMVEFLPFDPKLQVQLSQRSQHQHHQRSFDNIEERLETAKKELKRFQEKQGEAHNQVEPGAGFPPEKATIDQEQLIRQLTRCLQSKEEVLQDCLDTLLSLGSPEVNAPKLETLVKLMALRLKDRDQALEKTQFNNFLALECVHRQLRDLQEALKDKDVDLARLHTILGAEAEIMHAVGEFLNQKERETRRLESVCASIKLQNQTLVFTLKEKETLIKALQEALTSSTKDVEALANSLGSSDLSPALLQQIQEKEDLLAQSLAEQARLQADWQRRLQVVEDAASARERKLQEQLHQQSQDAKERSQDIPQLRRLLAQAEDKLGQAAALLREQCTKLADLQEMEYLKAHVLEEALREGEEKDRLLQRLQAHLATARKHIPEEQSQVLLPLT